MIRRFLCVFLVLAVFVAGCGHATPPAACPMPAKGVPNVIVPQGNDPPFVIRFEQRDPTGWAEARNIAVPNGEPVLLRLTHRASGGKIDFMVIRAPSAAACVDAIEAAKKALVSNGAEVTARQPAPPSPERSALRYAIAAKADKKAVAGEVEVRSFLPRPWALLAVGSWPAAEDAALLKEFDSVMESMTFAPTGPLGPKAALAQCLADKGVKLYSAWWCGPCQWQKQQFGDAGSRLPVVECYPEGGFDEIKECRDAKLKSVPTWQFPDGSRVGGSMPLPEIAKLSGCPYEG